MNNGPRPVAPAPRDRVVAITALGHRPDRVARAMAGAAVELVLGSAPRTGRSRSDRLRRFPSRLVVRRSCGCGCG